MTASTRTRHPSDSTEQVKAGDWLLAALSKRIGVELSPKQLHLRGETFIRLNGFSAAPPILCQVTSRIGPPKVSQKHKVMSDAMKMLLARRHLDAEARCILLFADEEAAAHFRGNSWLAQCLREFRIEVELIELPPELAESVRSAQRRQYR